MATNRQSGYPDYLIGLVGSLGAGKSLIAWMLTDIARQHGVLLFVLPFAHPLKTFARQLGWNGKKDEKGRRLLQLLGTECGRECIDPEIWIKRWNEAILECKAAQQAISWARATAVIADDVRFDNEARFIVNNGGLLIQVTGRGGAQGAAAAHQSENDLSNWRNYFRVVKNDGSSLDLFNLCDRLWSEIEAGIPLYCHNCGSDLTDASNTGDHPGECKRCGGRLCITCCKGEVE